MDIPQSFPHNFSYKFSIFGMVTLGCQLNGIWNDMPLDGSIAAFPGIINCRETLSQGGQHPLAVD